MVVSSQGLGYHIGSSTPPRIKSQRMKVIKVQNVVVMATQTHWKFTVKQLAWGTPENSVVVVQCTQEMKHQMRLFLISLFVDSQDWESSQHGGSDLLALD